MHTSHLLIRNESGAFRSQAIAARVEIGRDPGCDLVLEDTSVSRRHASLIAGDTAWTLQDEHSRGGTILNGSRIAAPTAVHDGDWIRIGACLLLLCAEAPTAGDEQILDQLAGDDREPSPSLDATQVLFSMPTPGHVGRATATAPQLALLENVSDALRTVTDLDDILTVLLGVAFDVLAPQRGVILLRTRPEGEFEPAIAHPETETGFASRTLLAAAMERRATVVVRDVERDERFAAVPSLQLHDIRAAICCPLISRDEVVGAIYLDTHLEGLNARREEVGLLNFIACYAATAVENALLLRERSRARTLADLDEEPLIARSEAMARTTHELEAAAAGADPLRIEGETGTGKLLAARHVHLAGPGRDAPFLAIDCAMLSGRDLRELLAGPEGGPPGAWQDTARGTLVLEHVDALDRMAQHALLELLETPGPRLITTSTGPIASVDGFSPQLAARIGTSAIVLPRLRERGEDILPLARNFLARAPEGSGRSLGASAIATLEAARYKEANVSELRAAIELAAVLSDGPTIEAEHVFTGPTTRAHRLEFDLGASRVVRWLIDRTIHTRFAIAVTVVFAALIACCLVVPDRTAGRVANGLVWGLWWPALLVVFLSVGRLWCTWCPVSKVARWAQSAWSLAHRPPAWIKKRAAWVMATLFALIVWSEHFFHMPERPFATGIFLIVLAGTALLAAAWTRGEVWCRFACPLGNLSACYSVPATVHVHANPMICQSQCKTHECYKGTEAEAGCPMYLHPLYVKDSHFCKLCMSCVRNCPNDSAKLWIRPPLQDVWSLSELNPQLVPLALSIFLLAPLMLARTPDLLLYSALVVVLLLAVFPLRALLQRFLAPSDPLAPTRVAFSLALLAWGPLMAFHLGNVPGLDDVHLHGEAHAAVLGVLAVLPSLQLLSIFGASLAASAVLGRLRARSDGGRWWPIHILVILYIVVAAGLVL